MATVYSETTDGYVVNTSTSDAATCRGDASTSGSFSGFGTSSSVIAIENFKSARGGGTWFNTRSYLVFDLSSESGTVDSCGLIVYMDNTTSGGVHPAAQKVIAVEATALAGSAADYGNCFSSGSTLGTAVSAAQTISTTAGYHTFIVTGDTSSGGIKVINDAIGSGSVTICLMDNTWDYLNADIGGTYGTSEYVRHSVSYANYSGTSRDPKLIIVYETVTATADNATFFGANF